MTTIRRKNFSKGHLAKLDSMNIQNGDTFEACNFGQAVPHTAILAGYTGLTFTKCRLINCDLPGDAVVDGGLHFHNSLCSHLHPNKSQITPCAEDCDHVVDSDTVTIDGQVVGTTYHYKDIAEV